MNCLDCSFANKSGNEGYVFCTYWQNKCNESKLDTTEFVKRVVFEETLLDKVALGWGYPSKHYSHESHWSYKGTASEGLMWNNQICVEKEQWCQNHKM